jgi:Zn-dependent metalloprotease
MPYCYPSCLREPGTWAARLLTGVLLMATGPLNAQTTISRAVPQERGVPMMIDLRQGPANAAPRVADKQRVLREQLALTAADDMRPIRTETDELGFVHERLQPYYQGVKVEHATISLHERAGKIEMLSGNYERPSAGASARPALTEAVALQRATAAIGARRYMWQDPAEEAALKQQTQKPTATYQPKGELVWVGDFRQPEANRPIVLAWKFNIYAAEPISRDWVYIDARTGQMVMRNAIIKHVNAAGATFATRYLGARTSITDNTGTGFRLRETATGKGVTTLNLRKSTTFSTAVDFIDNDNNWTAAEHDNANFDNAALDAHLGAQTTQGYWTTVHGRDSYDDRGSVLLSYVHYGNGTDNAYWDGTAMLYGDGSSLFKPLTSVDVCGHEIGHAVCETTANLVYQNESGALNEGLSDIWGCCVENHLDPTKQVYLIGEDICKPSFGLALRSMSNPNQFGQPDTYLGTNWATGAGDNGGVHTNSGVLNFWFYLLSHGGSGTNDNGTAYNVTAISIAKAAFITYRAERLYMTTSTNYAGARKATMQAAVDLYGLGSPEVTNTARAWRAVGLGEGTPTLTSFSPTSGLSGTVVTLTGTNLGTTFSVTFNGTPATIATLTSSTSVAVTVPPGATTGPIVVTTSGGSATSATNFVITAAGPSPVITSFTPAAGQVQGGAVTITGTSFTGATAVSFNGTAATFSVVNATTITTTVPNGATTGALTVTTPNGTATAPGTFTVLPNITSFTPTSGVAGASVVITGTSFTGALTVKFNGTYATSFTVNSATSITATVAAGTTTGPITVRTPSGTATSATNFTVTPSLAFNSFSPTSGPVGTVVLIRGIGFTGTTAVTFGGVNAPTFTVASDLELWATVPTGAQSGNIVLTTPIGNATSPTPFGVIVPGGPTVTSFTPTSGAVGTAVTITGTNFTGATAVTFNGTAATFTVVNATTINTNVPAGATTGPIGVTTSVGTGLSSTSFALPPANDLCTGTLPVLTCGGSITGTTLGSTSTGDPTAACGANTPSAAAGGVFYRMTGTGGNITVATCTSSYDGVLYVYSGTCGAYTCVGSDDDGCGASGSGSTVTFASTLGTQYFVYVSGFNGGKGTFTLTATCPPPATITSFTPTSGASGTVVTITGTNLSGATAVRFNGIAASSFTVNSSTEIVATVSATATTGPITVVTPAGTATSATNFTITVGAPTITSFTPTTALPGTTVTLTGTNFSGTMTVNFNGTPATFSVTNNTTMTTTVPFGSTTGPISVTTPTGTATSATNFTPIVPPANDLCTGTLPALTCGSSVTGTTINATVNGDPVATCVTSITAPGVFYRFTGTGALVTLSTCGATTTFDSKLHVFTGSCGSYVCVTGNDDTACGSQSNVSSVTFNSVVGTDYLVFVSGFNSSTGPFVLGATCVSPPTITGFSPTSGLPGASVTISGTDFTGTTAVRFNGTTATFTVVNATTITATVPVTATTGTLSVTNPAGTATSAATFTVLVPAPTITSFTPTSGTPSTLVTLTGTAFTGATAVSFNGTAATSFTVVSATSITATVATGTTTGPISVTTSGGTATSATSFTVLQPPANDLCTGTLPVLTCGGSVTGTTINATTTGDPTASCVTSITAPGVFYRFTGTGALVTMTTCGATTTFDSKLHIFTGTCGNYVCVTGNDDVTCGAQTAVSSVTFSSVVGIDYLVFVSGFNSNTGPFILSATCVSPPTITSFTPTSGLPGASVTISGTGFTGATGVRFNGTTAAFTVVNATTITATVPATATTGTLSVTNPAGTATSAATFTVLVPAPTITSFTPASGPIGATVTLTGTGFTGATAVRFNGTAAAFTLNSATSITTNVPFTATTGPISVTNATGTGTSATNFTVTASPANDLCSAPSLPVLTCGTSVTGTTVNATTIGDPTATCVTSITAPGVFYRFVGTGGSVTMTTCGATTTFDTKLYVFTGTCGNYVCVTGNDDLTCGTQTTVSSVTFNSVAGTNYFIFVAGFNTNTGPFILNTTCVPVTPTVTSFNPTSGLEGTSVAITGTNLTAASAVRFNGTAASTFTVNSATSITATVPVGATTGPISVTVPGGTGTSATNFRVLHAPVIGPQTFGLAENSANSTVVGTVTASDPDAGETLSYSITGGNTGGAFNFSGNQLVVANATALDFETTPTFSLTVQVTDNGPSPQSASATVTVNLSDVAEGPTGVGLSPQSLPENQPTSTAVGNFSTTGPGTGYAYSLVSGVGSTDNASFQIVGGQLLTSTVFNFEGQNSYAIRVRSTDNANANLFIEQPFTITVTDVNETPVISPQTFAIAENAANGSVVGSVSASDPDASTTLTYSITGGNTSGAFVLVGNSLQVANSAALDFETTPTFSLTVQASDGSLSSSATVTVNLADIVEDLIVTAPTMVPGGTYHNITVTGTGVATLGGPVVLDGALTVQTGGVFDDGCQLVTGSGAFALQAGATLRVCHPQGIAANGATGAIQLTGARSYASAATYVYTGSVEQLTGSGLPATVDQLTVENPTMVALSNNLGVRRVLTLAGAGNLLPSDFVLTILSDATNTALVVNAGSGVVMGPATVQRFIAPGTAPGLGYRHLSAPVTNSRVSDLTVAGTNGFTPVVNPNYNTAAAPLNVRPYPTIFGYDETRGGPTVTDFSRGYFSPAALTSPLVPGRGYSVYMKPLTPDFVGTLGNGPVTMAGLTHTGPGNVGGEKPGWHLLGNPYPAPIDWDLVTVPAGMDAAISVYKSTGGNNGIYLTRANGLGTLTDGLVPMGQAFFARVTSNSPIDFTFENAHRLTSYANPSHFRAAPEARPIVTLTLRAAGASADETDQATVYFEAGATAAADARFDGVKPGRNVGVPTLVSLTPTNDELAVNGLSDDALTTGLTVPLLLEVPAAGTYELAVSKLMNMRNAPIALLDRLTGTRYDLATSPVVTYTATQGGEVRNRFALVIGTAPATAPELALWPNPAHHAVRVTLPAGTTAVTILDATGRTVRTQVAATTDLTVDLAGLPTGVYVVKAGAATARLVVE